jgi:hypothetical protein
MLRNQQQGTCATQAPRCGVFPYVRYRSYRLMGTGWPRARFVAAEPDAERAVCGVIERRTSSDTPQNDTTNATNAQYEIKMSITIVPRVPSHNRPGNVSFRRNAIAPLKRQSANRI